MRTSEYKRLGKGNKKAIAIRLYVIGFISIVHKHMAKGIGVRIVETINNNIWMFTLYSGDENVVLFVKNNGTSHIYSQKPLDYMNEEDRKCMSLQEFLEDELSNQRVKKFQLEKILFRLL